MDSGATIHQQRLFQEDLRRKRESLNASIAQVGRLKAAYDEHLLSGDLSNSMYYVMTLANRPELVCSTAHTPEHDFRGNELQGPAKFVSGPDFITFSLLATDSGGVVVWQWLQDYNPVCDKLIRSFHEIAEPRKAEAIVRFAFVCCDNTFFSPDWWESLADGPKLRFQQRAMIIGGEQKADFLTEDRVESVSWRITSVATNVPGLLT
jgi:hypothetical protein